MVVGVIRLMDGFSLSEKESLFGSTCVYLHAYNVSEERYANYVHTRV